MGEEWGPAGPAEARIAAAVDQVVESVRPGNVSTTAGDAVAVLDDRRGAVSTPPSRLRASQFPRDGDWSARPRAVRG
ncbi:hypothetical protein ADK58_13685 [Streptomyces sp. XY152]|nr:hypothetical protein ADK58_13685 [Streptomyces sp. XY152]